MDASQSTRGVPGTFRAGILLVAFVLLSACASTLPAIAAPEVRLTSVELSRLGLYGQTFLLGIHVSNPNPFPLPVSNVRYELRLDDDRFAGGETRGGFVVPPGSATEFAISVELDLRHSVSGLNTLIESGFERSVQYQLQGSLQLDLPAAKPLSFAESGSVRLRLQ